MSVVGMAVHVARDPWGVAQAWSSSDSCWTFNRLRGVGLWLHMRLAVVQAQLEAFGRRVLNSRERGDR